MPSLSSFALALPIRSDCLPTPGSDYQAAHISWPPPRDVDHIARRTTQLYAFRRPAPMPFCVAGTARHGFPGLGSRTWNLLVMFDINAGASSCLLTPGCRLEIHAQQPC